MSKSEPFKRCFALQAGGLLLALLSCATAPAATDTNRFTAASFDNLMICIQRYGSTESKREDKRLAREEMFARKGAALTYLMDHSHVDNMWFGITAGQLVDKLSAQEAVPILLPYLDTEKATTRKYAVYWLGFYDAPEHAAKITPLLADETTAGVALRTLGKWKAVTAVPEIHPYLWHEKERLRILAVNALRDIGASASIPYLLDALEDDRFTVRKCAARALSAYGRQAEKPILAVLNEATGPARRELIGALGGIATRRCVASLRRLLSDSDPLARLDAARALLAADPARATGWLTAAGIDPDTLRLKPTPP